MSETYEYQQLQSSQRVDQMQKKSVGTCENGDLRDFYDANTRYIKYPLGPNTDLDVQIYILNMFNQFLKQNLSFCEVEKPVENLKEKFFVKLYPEVNPMLVFQIIDKILKPIIRHINKYTEENCNVDQVYDQTMELIKKLNAVKIQRRGQYFH